MSEKLPIHDVIVSIEPQSTMARTRVRIRFFILVNVDCFGFVANLAINV